MTFAWDETIAAWGLVNSGLGPAILRRFEVYVDDKPQPRWAAVAKSLGVKKYTFNNPATGAIIPVGSNAELLFSAKRSGGGDALKNNFQRVRMDICYCSLIDECWETSTRQPSRKAVKTCRPPRLGEVTWDENNPM